MSDTIGTRILKLRGEQSQQQLAEAIGVSRELVKAWEGGTRKVKSEDVVKLARHFGVPTDYLLCMEGSVPSLDIETRAICRALGLSEEAVKTLRLWNGMELDLAGRLISSRGFGAFIEALGQLERDHDLCLRAISQAEVSLKRGRPEDAVLNPRDFRMAYEIGMYKLWEALREMVKELVPFEATLSGPLAKTHDAVLEANLSAGDGVREG